jgi:S1-C subfamily serine protease
VCGSAIPTRPVASPQPDVRRSATPIVAIVVAGVVALAALAVVALVVLRGGSGTNHATGSTTTSTVARSSTRSSGVPRTLGQLFAADSSGVIRIDVTTCNGSGVGSGFLIAPNLIVTAAHVVSGAATILLREGAQSMSGQVVGIDESIDVALVQARSNFDGHLFKIAAHPAGVGTPVAALGFPEGLPITLTQGTISGVDRSITIEGVERSGLIQTDAAVNPGNSGGPLMRIDGTVVGIVDAVSTAAQGISFAVSPKLADPLLQQWKAVPQPSTLTSCLTPVAADVQPAVGLVQEWATALASGDWVTARLLDPALASSSDATLASGYGGLKGATIVYVAGPAQDLKVASVAYEDVAAGERTNVYCFEIATFTTDTQTQTLNVLAQRTATQSPIPGWVDPTTLTDVIATCA